MPVGDVALEVGSDVPDAVGASKRPTALARLRWIHSSSSYSLRGYGCASRPHASDEPPQDLRSAGQGCDGPTGLPATHTRALTSVAQTASPVDRTLRRLARDYNRRIPARAHRAHFSFARAWRVQLALGPGGRDHADCPIEPGQPEQALDRLGRVDHREAAAAPPC